MGTSPDLPKSISSPPGNDSSVGRQQRVVPRKLPITKVVAAAIGLAMLAIVVWKAYSEYRDDWSAVRYTTHVDRKAEFSMPLPLHWRQKSALQKITLIGPDSNRMVAVSANRLNGLAEQFDLGPLKRSLERMYQKKGFVIQKSGSGSIDGRKSVWFLVAFNQDRRRFRGVHHLFFRGSFVYEILCSCVSERFNEFRRECRKMVAGFKGQPKIPPPAFKRRTLPKLIAGSIVVPDNWNVQQNPGLPGIEMQAPAKVLSVKLRRDPNQSGTLRLQAFLNALAGRKLRIHHRSKTTLGRWPTTRIEFSSRTPAGRGRIHRLAYFPADKTGSWTLSCGSSASSWPLIQPLCRRILDSFRPIH